MESWHDKDDPLLREIHTKILKTDTHTHKDTKDTHTHACGCTVMLTGLKRLL